jgi:DNA polymerase III subunit alpha
MLVALSCGVADPQIDSMAAKAAKWADMTAAIRKSKSEAAAPKAQAAKPFVHLKVHSAYSLLEGALPIKRLSSLAEQTLMPALALTDTNNLFGALEFSNALSDEGVQPIVGVSMDIAFGDGPEEPTAALAHASQSQRNVSDGRIALLAMSSQGYQNLLKIVSQAHLQRGDTDNPHLSIAALSDHCDGLIALTGGPDGPINGALAEGQQNQRAGQRLMQLREAFGDRLYIELQRHPARLEPQIEAALLDLAYKHQIPLVATNEVYFAERDDYEAHDALLCISEGRYVVEDDRRRVTPDHHFKSSEEMTALFADLPEAIDNTVEIARRCAFRPKGRKPILPRFVDGRKAKTSKDQLQAEADELCRQAQAGLAMRLETAGRADGFTKEDYDKRLAFELDIISGMKFPGYFLIVADFIKWAKSHDIPVGPGRGSGAGSLVAWSLTITDLDPLRFGLLFERFLNPERISMPDFDIDFCQDRREEVIQYVQEKYGADRVAQIITHGKLQARAVLRDVGRVLQMPYGQVDRLCKLIPNNPANPVTLPEAIDGEPKLQEERDHEPVVAHLLEIAQKLEGLYRHASTHAAGIVIGDRPLDELVPLYRDPKSNAPVTQFNWKMVEAAGLVKFDFLGLKTLTVLQTAVDLIQQSRGVTVDLPALPLDDKAAYELLARADTVGVFQLESTGMRESLKRLKPDRFEDIIAMVALYRPGPMDNIPTYIHRKHGEEPVDYLHPMLEPILKETYGVIIYQEQVMQIAQVMAGYSLGDADLLRRAMGKKDKREMARQRARFVDGAVDNNVNKSEAVYIFELVDKFAGYGFNKSHAAAYALVSYHTAYLKANYREEFLAASMTLDMGNTDKLAMFATEARRSGIEVRPPSVNHSGVAFSVEPTDDKDEPAAIRYSLAALKNIGASAVESIVATRDQDGRFKSLADFSSRTSPRLVNKRGLETLSMAGAFDDLEPNRALVKANVEGMLALSNRCESNSNQGMSDLFGGEGDAALQLDIPPAQAWTPMERLQAEFSAIGFFLSGHPLDQYQSVLTNLGVTSFSELEAKGEVSTTSARLAAIVVAARERRSQKGNKFAFGAFSDATGQFEAVIFSDVLAQAGELLEPGTPVLLVVEAEHDGETLKMRVQSIESLDRAAARIERGLRVRIDRTLAAKGADAIRHLQEVLKPCLQPGSRGGEVRLVLDAATDAGPLEFALPNRYDVSPAQTGRLEAANGVLEVVEF